MPKHCEEREAFNTSRKNQTDEKLETRFKEVETFVVRKGLTRSKIVDAIGSLGAVVAAPGTSVAAANQATQAPALPGTAAAIANAQTGGPQAVNQPAVATAGSGTVAATLGLAGTSPVTPGVCSAPIPVAFAQPAIRLNSAVPTPLSNNASGDELYRRGVELLWARLCEAARDNFRRAWQFQG